MAVNAVLVVQISKLNEALRKGFNQEKSSEKVLHVIPSVSSVHGDPTRAPESIEAAPTKTGFFVAIVTTDDNGPSGENQANKSATNPVPIGVMAFPQGSVC